MRHEEEKVYVRKESEQICEQDYFKSELPDSGFEDHPINKVHSSIKTNPPFIPPSQLKHNLNTFKL